jgi:hypothetical protein
VSPLVPEACMELPAASLKPLCKWCVPGRVPSDDRWAPGAEAEACCLPACTPGRSCGLYVSVFVGGRPVDWVVTSWDAFLSVLMVGDNQGLLPLAGGACGSEEGPSGSRMVQVSSLGVSQAGDSCGVRSW